MSPASSAEAELLQTQAWWRLNDLPGDKAGVALLKAYRKQCLGPVELTVRNMRLHRLTRFGPLRWAERFLDLIYGSIVSNARRRSDMVSELRNAPKASVVLPVLVAHAESDSMLESWMALNEMDPQAGPELFAYVRLQPDSTRAQTLLCLLQPFRTNCGEPNVAQLRDIFLHDLEPPTRALAARGLGKLGHHAFTAVADLQSAATNRHEWLEVQKSATEALQAILGTNSPPVPPR